MTTTAIPKPAAIIALGLGESILLDSFLTLDTRTAALFLKAAPLPAQTLTQFRYTFPMPKGTVPYVLGKHQVALYNKIPAQRPFWATLNNIIKRSYQDSS